MCFYPWKARLKTPQMLFTETQMDKIMPKLINKSC